MGFKIMKAKSLKVKTTISDKIVYNSEAVAKSLGITAARLASLRFRKQGPKFFKIGKYVYYYEKDVRKYKDTIEYAAYNFSKKVKKPRKKKANAP